MSIQQIFLKFPGWPSPNWPNIFYDVGYYYTSHFAKFQIYKINGLWKMNFYIRGGSVEMAEQLVFSPF